MIPGYIDSYKQIELNAKSKVDEQVHLYATCSPYYSKDKLRQNMQVYRMAINLKSMISAYNLKQQQQSVQNTAVK